jgi:hypothetical protein
LGTLAENLLKLLEQARIEELREDLTAKGFVTTSNQDFGTVQVSLLAERSGLRIAYEIVSSDRLQDVAAEIAAKRELVLSLGIQRFLIAVVSLPKTTEVEIKGLLESLKIHLLSIDAQVPLPTLGPDTTLTALSSAEYDSVTIDHHKTRVVGSAMAIISHSEPADYSSEEDEEVEQEIPFNFDISFLPDLTVKTVHFLEFDTSEYDI